MFKFVGWLVVNGFALYGLARFVDNHVVSDKANQCSPENHPVHPITAD